MREIKFRAVMENTILMARSAKQMGDKNISFTVVEFELSKLTEIKPSFSIRELVIPWLRKGNKPDIFTDLQDKNGKDIYEGDILRVEKFLFHVIYHDAQFSIKECGKGGDFFHIINIFEYSEIIGNIHETKELLGDNQCIEK